MNTPVYNPRAVRAGMLNRVNEIQVDTSILNTSKGVYVPGDGNGSTICALWVSAKINGFRMNRGALGFLGDTEQGGCFWGRETFRMDMYELVDELNKKAKEHNWVFGLCRIDTWEKVLLALLEGWTVMVGGSVYESFNKAELSSIVPMPKPGEALLGGQVVNIVSFDQEEDTAQVFGNQGMNVGRRGFFTYRGSYLRNLGICRDFFVLIPRCIDVN